MCIRDSSHTSTVFLAGRQRDLVPNIFGSTGTLCVKDMVTRFLGPGQVTPANTAGRASLEVDLGAIPLPLNMSVTAAQPGDTFAFQCWYRDVLATGAETSNLTNAVEITFN